MVSTSWAMMEYAEGFEGGWGFVDGDLFVLAAVVYPEQADFPGAEFVHCLTSVWKFRSCWYWRSWVSVSGAR